MTDLVWAVVSTWMAVELAFLVAFYTYYIPKANRRTKATPYRDPNLLHKILDRLEQQSRREGRSLRLVVQEFLTEWFEKRPGAMPTLTQVSSSETSSIVSTDSQPEEDNSDDAFEPIHWTIPGLCRTEMDRFLSWAFLAKEFAQLTEQERLDLLQCYDTLEQRLGLQVPLSKTSQYTPRRLTLEDVNPMYRPWSLYMGLVLVKFVMGIFLRLMGFERITAENGLVAWYRPARTIGKDPMLFFHGIAPGGFTLYVPMVLWGLAHDGRACFLFENKAISYAICDEPMSEQAMVNGVVELVHTRIVDPTTQFVLACHSFGSCPITWLTHEPSFQKRIAQMVLIDPVSILLSEPDVMRNFLYTPGLIRWAAASELFIEQNLRRNFSWYNSELWLDGKIPTTLTLSGRDEIVPAAKVAAHAATIPRTTVLFASEAKHVDSVVSPSRWRAVYKAMCSVERP